MKVVIGADGAGFPLKAAIAAELTRRGYALHDATPEPAFYADAAKRVAEGVRSGAFERGIVICGTGMGVSIAANKHRGIYAALCESVYAARRARAVNNTNVLCMGAFIVGPQMGLEMALAWLETAHLEGIEPQWRDTVQSEFEAFLSIEEAESEHRIKDHP